MRGVTMKSVLRAGRHCPQKIATDIPMIVPHQFNGTALADMMVDDFEAWLAQSADNIQNLSHFQ